MGAEENGVLMLTWNAHMPQHQRTGSAQHRLVQRLQLNVPWCRQAQKGRHANLVRTVRDTNAGLQKHTALVALEQSRKVWCSAKQA